MRCVILSDFFMFEVQVAKMSYYPINLVVCACCDFFSLKGMSLSLSIYVSSTFTQSILMRVGYMYKVIHTNVYIVQYMIFTSV